MKRKSRKELLARIDELERENSKLRGIERINTVIKEKDLPKCESNICKTCMYCEFYTHPNGFREIVGCKKDAGCANYTLNPFSEFYSRELARLTFP